MKFHHLSQAKPKYTSNRSKPQSATAYLLGLEDGWRRGVADWHHGYGALRCGGRQEVVPEPRGVDGELGPADWAGAARQPDRHAQERAAGAARQPRAPDVGGGAGQGQRLPPGRRRRHELRRERLRRGAVRADEFRQARIHLQRLAAPRALHLQTLRRSHGSLGGSSRLWRRFGGKALPGPGDAFCSDAPPRF
jgi:hypothetical protein